MAQWFPKVMPQRNSVLIARLSVEAVVQVAIILVLIILCGVCPEWELSQKVGIAVAGNNNSK